MSALTVILIALGILKGADDKRKTKKAIDDANRKNIENRRLIRCKSASIDSLIDTYGISGNLILSGGDANQRNRAIARLSHQACYKNECVVVLHIGNQLLEQEVEARVGSSSVQKFNSANPYYDPFHNLSRYEVGSIILESSATIEPTGRYIIEGMYDYMTSKGNQPSTYLFAICPYHELVPKVKSSEAKLIISAAQSRSIVAKLLQGEKSIPNVANYFLEFYNQSKLVLAKDPLGPYGASIFSSVLSNKIVLFDIISPTNDLLINVVACEIERLLTQGMNVKLIIDGVPYSASPILQKVIKTSGHSCQTVLSDQDVYSMFHGEDAAFFGVTSRAENIFISKHLSVHSCQKWSDIIGSFEKVDISNSRSMSGGFATGFGGGQTVTMSDKKEYIVRPEEIKSMKEDQFYIISKSIDGVMIAVLK